MRWIRLRCVTRGNLRFPAECPNCLTTPADHPVAVRGTGAMGLLGLSYIVLWPFCEACATVFEQRKRRPTRLGIYPSIVLVSVGVVAMVTLVWSKEELAVGICLSCLGLAIMFGIGGHLWVFISTRISPLENGRISNFETVHPRRAVKKMLSDQVILDIDFLNPKYVIQLVQENPDVAFKYKSNRLEQALREYEGMKLSTPTG